MKLKLHYRVRRGQTLSIVLGVLFGLGLAVSVFLEAQEGPSANRIIVQAYDRNGSLLRSGLGIIYDEHTVLTGYETVKGAASIRVSINDVIARATEMSSGNTTFDLAVLKSDAELSATTPLASSDTVATGDSVFYFAREKGAWKLKQAQAKDWIDSGKGFHMIRLGLSGPAPREPSPLLNSAGSIVGWFPGGDSAVPLKAVHTMLMEKTFSIPLSDLIAEGKFWTLQEITPRKDQFPEIEVHEMKAVSGPAAYPFTMDLPANWPHQTAISQRKFLLIAINGDYGVSIALRISTAESDDLTQEMERTETLMLTALSRYELTPFQAGTLSGLKGEYEPLEPEGHSATVFYAMAGKKMYVLSAAYPGKYSEQLAGLIDKVLASFTISGATP